ncbi:MAG: nitroreductase family protein [Caldisericia bacterium]|nr:nitroreductase family protein [Caldisericia bacterium]
MEVKEAIEKRRAYRSLDEIEISEDMIKDLFNSAVLAPSCFNNQPERFIFVKSKDKLNEIFGALSKNNDWAKFSSMITVVYTKKDLDCDIKGREYFLFDTGMSVGFMILRATELGLVAHPIAGYDEDKVKEILQIPNDYTVITLIIFGKKREEIREVLTDKQKEQEINRPPRKPFEELAKII